MHSLKKLNIADWFSFYRMVAAPFLLVMIWLEERWVFTWFLLFSFMSDAIDGFLARKLKISSERGSQLDSLGDQITLVIGVIGLWVFEKTFIQENLALIVLAFIPYFAQLLIAFKKYGKATAFHTYLAKISAMVQSVFIIWTLFFGPVDGLFHTMIVIGILETLEEITLIFMYKRWVSDVKGIYWALKDTERKNTKN